MMDDSAGSGQASDRGGLCARCAHVRLVPGRGAAVFYLCERSFEDPAYPRYPAIPVLACRGYEAAAEAGGVRPPPGPRP